jgi:hypothetical protein
MFNLEFKKLRQLKDSHGAKIKPSPKPTSTIVQFFG